VQRLLSHYHISTIATYKICTQVKEKKTFSFKDNKVFIFKKAQESKIGIKSGQEERS